ncbi:hypothetical protein PENTCL1PPCAC_15334, partial [Pristionchus entomophagus]
VIYYITNAYPCVILQKVEEQHEWPNPVQSLAWSDHRQQLPPNRTGRTSGTEGAGIARLLSLQYRLHEAASGILQSKLLLQAREYRSRKIRSGDKGVR